MLKPTMQTIADKLGISKNSVSLALSGKPGVSEELREKVEKTAEAVGYKVKKNTDTQRAHMVGLICREDVFYDHAFFGSIIFNIEQEVKKREGHLLVYSVDSEKQSQGLLPDFITQHKVDGLLVLSHLNLDYLKNLLNSDQPTVLIDHHHPELDVDCILTDNRKGAYRAVEYILNKGFRKIGFMGPIERSPSYQERYEGYVAALEANHLPLNLDWVADHLEENQDILKTYLEELNEWPECWFCVNDEYGLIVSRALTHLGLVVPEDCSVVGFDNSYFAKLSTPPLSTMAVNTEYFAKRSVSRLYDRMNNSDSPYEKILLDTELVERSSISKRQ